MPGSPVWRDQNGRVEEHLPTCWAPEPRAMTSNRPVSHWIWGQVYNDHHLYRPYKLIISLVILISLSSYLRGRIESAVEKNRCHSVTILLLQPFRLRNMVMPTMKAPGNESGKLIGLRRKTLGRTRVGSAFGNLWDLRVPGVTTCSNCLQVSTMIRTDLSFSIWKFPMDHSRWPGNGEYDVFFFFWNLLSILGWWVHSRGDFDRGFSKQHPFWCRPW